MRCGPLYRPLVICPYHTSISHLTLPPLTSQLGDSPLHYAAGEGYHGAVERLIRANANVNKKSQVSTGHSLHLSLHSPLLFSPPLPALLPSPSPLPFSLSPLLSSSSHPLFSPPLLTLPCLLCQDGYSPLHYAICKGHHGAVERLLQANANVNEKNNVCALDLPSSSPPRHLPRGASGRQLTTARCSSRGSSGFSDEADTSQRECAYEG